MATDLGRLESDPLFLGLTRPAMIIGITYSWLMLEMAAGYLVFINVPSGNKFLPLIEVVGISHAIGLYACSKEPKFIELITVWAKTWPKCTNRKYHGGRASYDLR